MSPTPIQVRTTFAIKLLTILRELIACKLCIIMYSYQMIYTGTRTNKNKYSAYGAPKHLYNRVNQKA